MAYYDKFIGFRCDMELLNEIDREIEKQKGRFLDRSNFVRIAIIQLLRKLKEENGEEKNI